MFERIIQFSLENKFIILLGTLALILIGLASATKIPLDAVPDITNNQVQIVSTAPTLAPQEVEQLITYPLEAAMTNIPDVVEVRSISRYGLSVITIVFEEDVDGMLARQYVQEQLNVASAGLAGLTEPELMPITTGLGEIYQYVLTVEPEFAHLYDATELRSIQDWIVKRQLNGTVGVIEVSSFGGYIKQYEVALDPMLLQANGITIPEVIASLGSNNQNSGGSYIEKGPYSFYIRTEGRVHSTEEIAEVLVKNHQGVPIKVADLGEVRIGSAKRYGAMTMDGKGEVVGGISLMLKGANSSEVLENVKERMVKVETSLPQGVHIYPYLDRSKLIGRTISTVKRNLIEGGLIVIFVLLLLLGNLRAGLIVASVIPLSMLFALSMMRYFGISANLMSLGAIDFGIVIDGAVIIVEGLLHMLGTFYIGKKLTQGQMDTAVKESTSKIYRSAAFGVLIILVVFIPILTLVGTEGKTFRPMAQTVGFAIIGSMLLSMTYVPVMSSIFLKKTIEAKNTFSDRIVGRMRRLYSPSLHYAIRRPLTIIVSSLVVFLFSIVIFVRLGAEFVPTLEEGDIAMQQSIKPGSSLNESIHTSTMAENILLDKFPEVTHVVSKIGTAEVPTDPMAIEDADIMVILKDKEQWTSATTREGLMAKMKKELSPISWASFEFTQPIQLRFNELMTGAKSDISVKIFGEDVEVLKARADEVAAIISTIDGAGDVKVDQTDGLQQLSVKYDRARLAQHGVTVAEVNQIIRTGYAGEVVGEIFEEERRYDLVVRLAPEYRQDLELSALTVIDMHGQQIPLAELAWIEQVEGPMLISREQARRFINIGVNLRNRDVSSLVAEIEERLGNELRLPPGYEIQYGGAFENLQHASKRLMIAVPIALALILLLLYLAFGSMKDTLIIFMAVPLSAVGGILALWVRDMPFSISSGIGFIALFGVSVLNGIVLLSAIKQLRASDFTSLEALISSACISRLRPVIMTAAVAALGFLPMALSTGSGAEVQRPLASVVIGGLISSTLLTLLVLPALYQVFNRKTWGLGKVSLIALTLLISSMSYAQDLTNYEAVEEYALQHHPSIENFALERDQLALSSKARILWGPTEIQYQNGQINYDGKDQQLQIMQDLSPIFRFQERSRQTALLEARSDQLDLHQRSALISWKQDLHASYLDWRYQYSRWDLQKGLLDLYERLAPMVELRYQTGVIDALEYGLFENEMALVKQDSRLRKNKLQAAEVMIRAMAFLSDESTLIPAPLPMIQMDTSVVQREPNLIVQQVLQEQVLIEKEMELENSRTRQAAISAGYFGQTIEDERLFQGFLIGVQIPLDTRQIRIRKKEVQIRKQRLTNETEYIERSLEQRIGSLIDEIELIRSSIQDYDQNILPRQKEILQRSQLQYQEGEVDFLRFSQIQQGLVQGEIGYFDLIKAHNSLVLQLNKLTLQNPY